MYRIKNHDKPAWESIRYPSLIQAEADILIAQSHALANGLPIPALYTSHQAH